MAQRKPEHINKMFFFIGRYLLELVSYIVYMHMYMLINVGLQTCLKIYYGMIM